MGRLALRPRVRRRAEGRPGAEDERRRACPRSAPCSRCRARRPPSSPRPRPATSSPSPSWRASMPANGWRAGKAPPAPDVAQPVRNYALAIATKDRKDDVRLSTALHKLTEEDRGAASGSRTRRCTRPACKGVNDEHLKVTLERLQAALRRRRRFAAAGDRLQGIDPQDRHPARPPQEAVGRPRPVRRLRDRGEAAAARRGLQVRRQDHRRRRAQAVDPGGRGRRARRARSRGRSASRWSTSR